MRRLVSPRVSGFVPVRRLAKFEAGPLTKQIFEDEAKYMVGVYKRVPGLVIANGHGNYVRDMSNQRYLDFFSGIAVNALGHTDKELRQVIFKQAQTLVHTSNSVLTRPQVQLAKQLVELSGFDKVFFTNSGTEANEAAFKFARNYAFRSKFPHPGPAPAAAVATAEQKHEKTRIVAFTNAFHGRTMGAVAATYKTHYRAPFEPVMPGVTFVPFNDVEAARAAITDDVCAVIVEPIQGEGGVRAATKEFMTALRESCDSADALLIVDEIQVGLGRTGSLWAHTAYDVKPDIMTLAKPLANGLPIGAVLVREKVAEKLRYFEHGSTFAGNPMVCAAALNVLKRVSKPRFLSQVKSRGGHLIAMLNELKANTEGKKACITEVRASVDNGGLLIGVELSVPAEAVIKHAREKSSVLFIGGGEKVLRLAPSLIIGQAGIKTAVDAIAAAIASLNAE